MPRGRFLIAILIIIIKVFLFSPVESYASEEPSKEIILNIPTLNLILKENGEIVKEYPVAVGKSITQTPIGKFKIINKVINPTWYPKGNPPIPPGPDNPLGYRWLGFHEGYGIHGNNNPKSIGTFVSLGCVRLHNKDIEELFERVDIGVPVTINYETMIVKETVYGEKYLEVYPDIYKLEVNTRENIIKKLMEENIQITSAKFERIFSKINREKVVFSPGYLVVVNNKVASSKGYSSGEDIFVDYKIIEKLMQKKLLLNFDKQEVLIGEKCSLPAKNIDEKLFVSLKSLSDVIGGSLNIDHSKERAELNIVFTYLNGVLITGDVFVLDETLYLPLRLLADNLGYEVNWDSESQEAVIGGQSISGILKNGKTYINVFEAEKIFHIDVKWEGNSKINVNSIRCFIDGRIPVENVIFKGEMPYLPLRLLAERLGYNVFWQNGAVSVNGKEVEIYLQKGIAYISADDAASIFDIYIGWNTFEKELNIITGKWQN